MKYIWISFMQQQKIRWLTSNEIYLNNIYATTKHKMTYYYTCTIVFITKYFKNYHNG
jgi:hypothetical protein